MRVRTIFALWLPLAVSFELMMLEGPTVQSAIGRLPDPSLNLAAWGLTISLSLLIESPVIMLLATAIALVRDAASYQALRRFTLALAFACTVLTALIAFTPLLDFVARRIMDQPDAIVQATRPALRIMLMWTAAIAWRRFYQGVLVHYGQTRRVSWGTAIRLTAVVSVSVVLAAWHRLPGVQVGACALMAAVITEAIATTAFALPVLRHEGFFTGKDTQPRAPAAALPEESDTPSRAHWPERKAAFAPHSSSLTQRDIWRFHAPLAATTLLTLVSQPMTAAALARLPQKTATLAVWPVVYMLVLVLRGWGLALQEITVAQARYPLARPALQRFAWLVGGATSGLTAVIALTPLLDLYLYRIINLPADLSRLAHVGVGACVFVPLLTALSSWAGGLLVAAGATQHRYRGMGINLGVFASLLFLGVGLRWPGMWIAAGAFTFASLGEYLYLARQARLLTAK